MTKQTTAAATRLLFSLTVSWFLVSPSDVSAQDVSRDQVLTQFARYGADVWAKNPMARLSGEGVACISCHTSLPYALVEPLLPGSYPAYSDLIDNIDNRILTWSDNTAWYAQGKLEQIAGLGNLPPDALKGVLNGPDSRGVEAIFNALIRATHDAYSDQPAQAETQLAFEHMWSEQVTTGPKAGLWNWIQANLIPWEVADSDLWGAALACVAASIFSELAPEDNLQLLHAALSQAAENDAVSLHAKSAILWCDAETGERLLETGLAARIVTELLELQHQNGGWALRDLGPWIGWEGSSADCCALREVRADAYATGFVTLALARRSNLVAGPLQEPLAKAVAWINQQLVNPYPAEPRNNRHGSADTSLPEFRNNLYTNAGHMWAFLARTVHERQTALWISN